MAKRLRLLRRLKQVLEAIQKQIASETRRVHAPLANRLGVWHIKWELEDLSLRYSTIVFIGILWRQHRKGTIDHDG